MNPCLSFVQSEKSLMAAKMAASKKFNPQRNVVDTFVYLCNNGQRLVFQRINRKYPNGDFYFGKWN